MFSLCSWFLDKGWGVSMYNYFINLESDCLDRLNHLVKNVPVCGTCPTKCDGCYYLNMKYLHCPFKNCTNGLLIEGRPYE